MAYLALYRVWRPQRFIEVVGQKQTVMSLKNAVKLGKLTHAYIFAGPRGTGKTSIAKILARAVNCENPVDGEPCNQCTACQDINKGNFMDVIEIDAASNRGIDEIRELREQVRVLPAQGKRKVYIIDEVHMLTTEAFNALLKTLEEPPEKVIFILATTEAHKIPATIISRCQKFNFYRLSQEQIELRLNEVAEKMNITIEPEAVSLIARRANGGMRDALGMLDQVFAYKGKDINKNDVLEILGIIDDVFIASLINDVLKQDLTKIVERLEEFFLQGKDARQISRESCLYLRDLLFFSHLGSRAKFLFASKQSVPFMKEQLEKVGRGQIIEMLDKMMDTNEKLRFNEEQRFLLEMTLFNMSRLVNSSKMQTKEPTTKSVNNAQTKQPTNNQAETNKGRAESVNILWEKILKGVKEIKIPTHALLSQGRLLGTRGETIYIGFKRGYKFHKEKMEEKANREILESVLNQIFERNMEIEFIFLDDSKYNEIVVKKAIEYFGEEIVEIKD